MSPTYWTASQIKIAARAHGWEFIKCDPPGEGPWGVYKDNIKIMFQEDRRGGLVWATLTRFLGAVDRDCVRIGRDFRNKKEAVLSWMTEPIDWIQWGFKKP